MKLAPSSVLGDWGMLICRECSCLSCCLHLTYTSCIYSSCHSISLSALLSANIGLITVSWQACHVICCNITRRCMESLKIQLASKRSPVSSGRSVKGHNEKQSFAKCRIVLGFPTASPSMHPAVHWFEVMLPAHWEKVPLAARLWFIARGIYISCSGEEGVDARISVMSQCWCVLMQKMMHLLIKSQSSYHTFFELLAHSLCNLYLIFMHSSQLNCMFLFWSNHSSSILFQFTMYGTPSFFTCDNHTQLVKVIAPLSTVIASPHYLVVTCRIPGWQWRALRILEVKLWSFDLWLSTPLSQMPGFSHTSFKGTMQCIFRMSGFYTAMTFP